MLYANQWHLELLVNRFCLFGQSQASCFHLTEFLFMLS